MPKNEVPDIHADESLFSEMCEGFYLLPEQNFILAFLERAILDYVGPANTPQQYYRSARSFFTSGSRELMSFHWCAAHLPWDTEWFKETIYRYLNSKLAIKATNESEDIVYHVID